MRIEGVKQAIQTLPLRRASWSGFRSLASVLRVDYLFCSVTTRLAGFSAVMSSAFHPL